jgi:hypothetical protein
MEIISIIDERKVVISTFFKARVGDYTVYENKLWRIVSYYGPAVGNYKGLRRENADETITVPNNITLYKVMEPTGYIAI